MAVSGYNYTKFHLNAQLGLISNLNDVATDINLCLLTDSYVPAQTRHDCYSAPDWVASTTYEVGDKVKPTTPNGHLYECVSTGTSGTGEPTWPTTDGTQISDDGTVWECNLNADISYFEITGTGYTAGGITFSTKSLTSDGNSVIFNGNNIVFASADFTARWAVIYDNTPVELDDKKLLGFIDFGENMTSVNADFQINWDSAGIIETTPAIFV